MTVGTSFDAISFRLLSLLGIHFLARLGTGIKKKKGREAEEKVSYKEIQTIAYEKEKTVTIRFREWHLSLRERSDYTYL